MAKGEDALRRKKNKIIRKRMRSDKSNVSARVAAIIASKQRRKSGKRRMCEGMCFSLPTPDNPFNDKFDHKKKKPPPVPSQSNTKSKAITTRGIHGHSDGPSKFLTMCLNAIQKSALNENTYGDGHLFLNKWGAEFLACSLLGTDILETTGGCSSVEQIAWMVSIAADIISIKEKEGLSLPNPFLLILVPTKEKALQVRTLCKPLKPLGIHTVSLHSDASLEHQIQGLKSCEPEFLVATPERLLELVSVNAIDISGLSFLVVDGLQTFVKCGILDQLKFIKQSILHTSLTVVFCDSFGPLSISAVRNLLDGPITRLSLTESLASQSACVSQCVHLCASQVRALKGVHILKEERRKRLPFNCLNVLFVEETRSKAHACTALLLAEGYATSKDADTISDSLEVVYSKDSTMVTVTDHEHLEWMDFEEFELVVITSFPHQIDDYIKILTGMARQSVNGALHSYFCHEDAPLAEPLIKILEQCDQNVPGFLKTLCPK